MDATRLVRRARRRCRTRCTRAVQCGGFLGRLQEALPAGALDGAIDLGGALSGDVVEAVGEVTMRGHGIGVGRVPRGLERLLRSGGQKERAPRFGNAR